MHPPSVSLWQHVCLPMCYVRCIMHPSGRVIYFTNELAWHLLGTSASQSDFMLEIVHRAQVIVTSCGTLPSNQWNLKGVIDFISIYFVIVLLCCQAIKSLIRNVFLWYSISQEICTRFLLCCALLWLYIDWFSYIHQAYFTRTVAI